MSKQTFSLTNYSLSVVRLRSYFIKQPWHNILLCPVCCQSTKFAVFWAVQSTLSFILQSSALWYLISPSPLTCAQFSKFFHFCFIPHSAGLYRQASAAERVKRFRTRAFKAFVPFGCQPDLHLAALWLMLTGALTPSRMLCSSCCSYQLLPLCVFFFFFLPKSPPTDGRLWPEPI